LPAGGSAYEVTSLLSPRLPRVYVGSPLDAQADKGPARSHGRNAEGPAGEGSAGEGQAQPPAGDRDAAPQRQPATRGPRR